MENKTINMVVMLPDGTIKKIAVTQSEDRIDIFVGNGNNSSGSYYDIIELVELLLTQDISIESIKTSVEKTLTIP